MNRRFTQIHAEFLGKAPPTCRTHRCGYIKEMNRPLRMFAYMTKLWRKFYGECPKLYRLSCALVIFGANLIGWYVIAKIGFVWDVMGRSFFWAWVCCFVSAILAWVMGASIQREITRSHFEGAVDRGFAGVFVFWLFSRDWAAAPRYIFGWKPYFQGWRIRFSCMDFDTSFGAGCWNVFCDNGSSCEHNRHWPVCICRALSF